MGILSYGYKAIKSVRPKTKLSDATKKFKSKVEATKKAIKKGTDDFKKENPDRAISDKQIKAVQREQTEKSNKKTRKEFLREPKKTGGRIGLKKGGKVLKPVDKQKNPGLAKLPTQVRNKMGYMKKGGRVKKFGGGKK